MHFSEVKKSIREDLLSRDLKNPKIRLNAIESIEMLLQSKINEMHLNPTRFIELIDKDRLKSILSEFKHNKRINDAESSIVNEIYYRVNSKK